jgi:hypothetical protein
MPNLFNCPVFKISDRVAILERILTALQDDPNCRTSFKGTWRDLTPDETANWEARQNVLALLLLFRD